MKPINRRPRAVKPQKTTVGMKSRQLKQNNGKLLEQMLGMTNQTYRIKKIALITKQHPEVKTIRDHKGVIRETIYSERSGLDYAGTVQGGHHVTFEAKQVKDGRRFPLDMIEPHQIETMRDSSSLGAHAFLVVFFVSLDAAFLFTSEYIVGRYDEYAAKKRKAAAAKTRLKPGEASLSFDEVREHGQPIIEGRGVFLDWIGAYEAAFQTDGP